MQFDMKQALFYFVDGFTATGAVNNVSGYAANATTMLVDTITGIIPVGVTFIMPEGDTVYKVTSHSETLGNTTSITFTPGLVDPAVVNRHKFSCYAAVPVAKTVA